MKLEKNIMEDKYFPVCRWLSPRPSPPVPCHPSTLRLQPEPNWAQQRGSRSCKAQVMGRDREAGRMWEERGGWAAWCWGTPRVEEVPPSRVPSSGQEWGEGLQLSAQHVGGYHSSLVVKYPNASTKEMHLIKNFCRWLHQTTAPSALREILKWILPSAPYLNLTCSKGKIPHWFTCWTGHRYPSNRERAMRGNDCTGSKQCGLIGMTIILKISFSEIQILIRIRTYVLDVYGTTFYFVKMASYCNIMCLNSFMLFSV